MKHMCTHHVIVSQQTAAEVATRKVDAVQRHPVIRDALNTPPPLGTFKGHVVLSSDVGYG